MDEKGQTIRRHPDIFTAEEAAEYLHLMGESSLASIRTEFDLPGFRVGKGFMYHREDLDVCARRMFGKDRQWQPNLPKDAPSLRLSGGRA